MEAIQDGMAIRSPNQGCQIRNSESGKGIVEGWLLFASCVDAEVLVVVVWAASGLELIVWRGAS